MEPDPQQPAVDADLRARAEHAYREGAPELPPVAEADRDQLIEELRIHQIELELQNQELRESQQRLAEAADQYASLYDFASTGYLTLTAEGNIQQANLTATTLLQTERGVIRSLNLLRFISSLHRGAVERAMAEARPREPGHPLEIELFTAQEERRWVVATFTREEGDTEQGLVRCALADCTELKRTQARLIESLEGQVRLLNSLDEGVVAADRDHVVTFWNRAMAAITGIDPGRATGQHLLSLVPALAGVVDDPAFATAKRPPELAWPDGRTFQLRRLPQPSGYALYWYDITETRLAEEATREVADILHEAQAIAGMASWSFDLDTGESLWSRNLHPLLRLPPEAPVPTHETLRDLVLNEDVEDLDRLQQQLHVHGRPASATLRIRCGDGDVRWFRKVGRPADNRDGHRVVTGYLQDVTESVESEHRLMEERERFATLFNVSDDLITLHRLDPDVPFGSAVPVEVNDAGHRMLGCTRDEAATLTVNDVIRPEDLGDIEQAYRHLWERGHAQFRTTLTARDGTRIPMDFRSRVFSLKGVDHVLSIGRDIRDDLQQIERIQETSDRYQNLFDHAGVGIGIIMNGMFVDANQAMLRMFNAPREALLGKTPEALSPEQQPDGESSAVKATRLTRLAQDGTPQAFTWTHLRADGSEMVCDITLKTMFNDSRDPILVTLNDITEQVTAEMEQKRLASAIEQAEESVVITDSEGTILYVNPHFCTVTGYTEEEALGQNPRILASGEHDEAFYRDMWQTLLQGRTWRGRMVNLRKDGERFTEEAVISPIRDANGAIINFVAVKRDITREESLHGQLLQAQKMQAVGLLAGGIAHDFNNLLTVIINNATFLRKAIPDESDARQDLQELLAASRRAADLTRQLLAFSRRQIMVEQKADLNDLVHGMQKMLQRLLPETVRLHVQAASQPLPVVCDPGQIEQVLLNLAVNARDAIEGDGLITVETGIHRPSPDHPEAYVTPPENWSREMTRISVTDTGQGIPVDIRDKMFDPFFTTKPIGEGTGLGLSTVFGIVRQHRGCLSLYSEPGIGTSFHIYLPMDKQDPAATPNQDHRQTLLPAGTETVLMIEDDPGVRRVSRRMLTSLGYQVIDAGSGQEAMAILRDHGKQVDLVLTDMVMPGMNGRDVAAQVKQLHPHIHVVFASGYPEAHLTRAGLIEDESIRLIRKPFQTEALAVLLREVLDGGPPGS